MKTFPHLTARALACIAIVALSACASLPKQRGDFHVHRFYEKSEHMIPMRDGVKLFTIVYSPKDASQSYPILLQRTPYSIAPYGPEEFPNVLGPSDVFDREGYIFVFQDIRGKFKSEGDYKLSLALPAARGNAKVDESTDAYDTIEWLLANVPNHNGKVGQWGISYPGWLTVAGMVNAHPALAASSPQASPADMFIGDDWHHNGAFRIMYAFSWLSGNARRRVGGPTEKWGQRFDYGTPWGYRFFLEAGSAADIDAEYFQGEVPAWTEFIENGTYNPYWQDQNALVYLDDIDHPVLNVAAWFDAEDFYGPMEIYKTIERENPGIENTLAVGPWFHGGWVRVPGDSLGDLRFDSNTSFYFQRQVMFPFFERHLRGAGDWNAPEAVVFQTGRNAWKTHDAWPPKDAAQTKLYLREGGAVAFEAPTASGDAFDEYVSDPNKPVPFSTETRTTQGHLWMVEDQRFAATRPDVLVYETEPLAEDVTIAGPIRARLFVSTTAADADWIVKLIDVYPGDAPDNNPNPRGIRMGDFQMLLSGEIMRGKFRNSFTDPEAMKPGEVTAIEFDLPERYHTFLKGHRIMVQIQSSWFPVYDRNPQTFTDIYRAKPEDYRKATQRIHRSADHPSHLVLTTVKDFESDQ